MADLIVLALPLPRVCELRLQPPQEVADRIDQGVDSTSTDWLWLAFATPRVLAASRQLLAPVIKFNF